MTDAIELTIVMPCLNEAETLAGCIEKARGGIERSGVRGEILVADNGSKDDSVQIAERLGARVIHVKEKDTATHYGVAFEPRRGNGLSWAMPMRATTFQRPTAS